VIDVEAVPWPFGATHACECPIEAVAEPVERKCNDDEPDCTPVPPRRRKGSAGHTYRRQRETGKVVGVDRSRQPLRDEDEQPLLLRCQNAAMFAHMSHGKPPHPRMCEKDENGLKARNGTCTGKGSMRRSRFKWAICIALAALTTALLVVWSSLGDRLATGGAPTGNPQVATAGHGNPTEADESPATLHDLETVTGALDQHELIGRRVDFQVDIAAVNNNTSFWVGRKDNRILVVLRRDNPGGLPRDDRNASPTVQPLTPGQMARIMGTIEELNKSAAPELTDQKVYIRADNVIPQG
jgi:hypothetical protein